MFELLIIVIICVILLVAIYLLYESYQRSKRIDGINSKAVLVTGCDSGLGLEMARHLHRVGFVVIATCLTSESTGYKLLNSIQENQKRLKTVILDITDEINILKAEKQIRDFLKSLGINGLYGLVNNAGVLCYGEFDWLTWRQCETQIKVNFIGTLRTTKHFLQDIIDSKGRIVFVTSMASKLPFPMCTTYCATKSGLEMFAEGLHSELNRFGVKIVVLRPGAFANTAICTSYNKDSEVMWNCMNSRQKQRYEEYFPGIYQHLKESRENIVAYNSPDESSLSKDIEEALCSINPRLTMTQARLAFRLLVGISALPVRNMRISIARLHHHFFRKFCEKKYPRTGSISSLTQPNFESKNS